MTDTLDMRPATTPDGSPRKPGAADKVLVAKHVPKIAAVACRFAKARQRKAVIYMLGAGDGANRFEVPMTKRTAEQLMNSLGDDRFDNLDLIIQSSGGDIHAAYLIMSMLHEHMERDEDTDKDKLVACVPARAQSAATLLCLGADKILLGDLGSLGPLDAQLRKGVTDAGTPNYVSALHLLKSLSRLQEFSLEAFTAMATRLDAHHVLHDAQIKYGIKYSRAITCPLFEHIESSEVGYWDQMLKTGEEYGRRLLEQGDLVPKDMDGRRDHIKSIVHKLVFEYPSHELVIDRGVLEELRLQADLIPEERDARRISREFAECASETLIMLVDPNGDPAPDGSKEIPLKDWQSIGTDETAPATNGTARDIVWTGEDGTFAMRVGLYRPAVKRRNRWDERTAADGGPATQYSGGPVEDDYRDYDDYGDYTD